MNRYIIIYLLSLVFVLFSFAKETFIIQFPWLPCLENIAFYYCENTGMFDKSGLDVEFRHWDSNTDVIKYVEDEKVDIGIQDAIPFLVGIDKGYDLISLMAIFQDTPISLVSSSKHNIKNIQDVKNKKIATTIGYEYLLEFISSKYPKLKENNAFIYVAEDALTVIKNNKADLITIFETTQAPLFKLDGIDINLIRYNEIGFDTYSHILFVKRKTYTNKRQGLEKLINTVIDGWMYLSKNQDFAVKFFMEKCVPYNKYAEYKFKNERDYKKYLSACFRLQAFYYQKGVGDFFGIMNRHRWKSMIDILKSTNIIKNDIDVTRIITNKFISDYYERTQK